MIFPKHLIFLSCRQIVKFFKRSANRFKMVLRHFVSTATFLLPALGTPGIALSLNSFE
ncbi:hypothetical protein PHSC3_001544 [Chlamydiales bacterium STE3]|nr:hypothetical protein PHSC3_001544 [Chlamydiales bacterium STE3]